MEKINTVAIVLEWENAEGLEREEALSFLERLGERVGAAEASIREAVTLIVVYDEAPDEKALKSDVKEVVGALEHPLQVRFLKTPDAPYYAKKGVVPFCVDQDIIVYADSDCDYVESWLEEIVSPIIRGEQDVVCGDTVAMTGTSLTEKISAVAWFFPLDDERDPLRKKSGGRFFANNFAARAEVMRAVPIPRITPGSRTHGALWMAQLKDADVRVFKEVKCLARHKQYESLSALFARAWLFGADKDVGNSIKSPRRAYRMMRAMASWFELTGKFVRRFFALMPLGMNPGQVVAAFMCGVAFQWVASLSQCWHALAGASAELDHQYADLIAQAGLSA